MKNSRVKTPATTIFAIKIGHWPLSVKQLEKRKGWMRRAGKIIDEKRTRAHEGCGDKATEAYKRDAWRSHSGVIAYDACDDGLWGTRTKVRTRGKERQRKKKKEKKRKTTSKIVEGKRMLHARLVLRVNTTIYNYIFYVKVGIGGTWKGK